MKHRLLLPLDSLITALAGLSDVAAQSATRVPIPQTRQMPGNPLRLVSVEARIVLQDPVATTTLDRNAPSRWPVIWTPKTWPWPSGVSPGSGKCSSSGTRPRPPS